MTVWHGSEAYAVCTQAESTRRASLAGAVCVVVVVQQSFVDDLLVLCAHLVCRVRRYCSVQGALPPYD